MQRILITGASGFLGWNLALKAVGEHEVVGTYLSNPLTIAGAEMMKLDIRGAKEVAGLLSDARPDVVFHLAALARVDLGEKEMEEAVHVNVAATDHVAKACAEKGVRLVYASTDLVFDGQKGFYREVDHPNPLSHYAKTKLEGERRIRERGGDWVICRMANMYGPDNGVHGCFATWMRKRFEAGLEVPLYHDQFRSFLYVEDAVKALLATARNSSGGEPYHLGGPERLNRVEFGKAFAEAFGYALSLIRSISAYDDGKGALRGADCSLDSTKAHETLRFRPLGAKAGLALWKENA